MTNSRSSSNTKILIECALMIALATVLSFIKIDMPFGGGLTAGSMVPLVFIAYRRGMKWGLAASFTHGILQTLLGLDNVRYASGILMAIAIVLLDYILAYGVLGFAGMFKNKLKSRGLEIALGAAVVVFVRFLCHFLSGWMIWDALWPNEFGLASPVYSLVYNGWYMLPELVITALLSAALVKWSDYKL